MSNDGIITRIRAYEARLPVAGGSYRMALGKVIDEAVSYVVAIETENGRPGYGEICPLGSNYLPAYAGNLDIMTSAGLATAEKIALTRFVEGELQ